MLELTDKEKARMRSLAREVAHTLHDDPQITILDWSKFKIDWYMEDNCYGRHAHIFLMFQPIISEDLCTYEASPEVEYLTDVVQGINLGFDITTSVRPYIISRSDFGGAYEGYQVFLIRTKLV